MHVHSASEVNDVVSNASSVLVRAHSYLAADAPHEQLHMSIVDSGNNRAHIFCSLLFFPFGVRFHRTRIAGIHGAQDVRVGIGTAYFVTPCAGGKPIAWIFPNTIYNPRAPVNLLCVNKFHYGSKGDRSGHKIDLLEEEMKTKDGQVIEIRIDKRSRLPLMETRPMRAQHARALRTDAKAQDLMSACAEHEDCNAPALYTHTHLNALDTSNVVSILNHPRAEQFNATLRYNLIDGLKHIKPLSQDRSQRDDAFWAGRMTQRHVPRKSRRPLTLEMGVLTHIVSDIGVVPVKDRSGNKYFVLYKCLYTQFRVVHRLRTKEQITDSWRKFITDFALQGKEGSIKVRVRFLVTDDDKSYVAGQMAAMNREKMIGQWTIAPYTHNANPAESEMRRIMENAVCALYSSGLPPSFLLDALEHGCNCSNMLYTSVCSEPDHKNKSPWERVKGTRPHIDHIARFGSKTYVFVNKDERAKGASHQWVGWYLGMSDNMLASRVYRPITHTVYDRFHTLHDSTVVYGDFLGAMYKQRVESDRAQRRYFNSAVDELLGAPENANDETLRVMRARPWARQPDPEERVGAPDGQLGAGQAHTRDAHAHTHDAHTHSRNNTRTREEREHQHDTRARKHARTAHSTSVPPAQQHSVAEASERMLTDAPLAGPALARAGRGQRTQRTLQQEQEREHANAQAQREAMPPVTPALTRWRAENNDDGGLSPADLDARARSRLDGISGAGARSLLGGVTPQAKLACMAAVDLTANFYEYIDRLVLEGDVDLTHDELMQLAAHEESEMSEDHLVLLQLSEEVSRRIAQTPEPTTRKQIAQVLEKRDVEAQLLREAMLDEVSWMVANNKAKPKNKWSVENLHEIDGKWVIKYKKTLSGLLDRVRARWVLRGDKQRAHKDFDPHKLYAPVASKTSNLTILNIAVQHGLMLFSIDVSKAFTISEIEVPDVHMRVPDFFDSQIHQDYAPWGADTTWELLTSLYGLRQASARYYDKIANDVVLQYRDSKGRHFRRSDYDSCCFAKGELKPGFDRDGKPNTTEYTCFSMHVDDKFVAVSSERELEEFKQMLEAQSIAYTLEPMSSMLGMHISYTRHEPHSNRAGKLEIDHDQYVTDAYNEIKRHPMIDQSKTSPLSLPLTDDKRKQLAAQETPEFDRERYKLFRSILGKVQHCSNYTHPEITTAVSVVSQNMMNPSMLDVECVFGILRYLYGTVGDERKRLTIKHNANFDKVQFKQNPVHMLSDADLSNCPLTRRSRTGWSTFLFSNLTGWKSQKQTQVSLSTCESEYVALASCAQFAKWYRGLVSDLGVVLAYCEPVMILTDSDSAMNLAKADSQMQNKYSRHIQQRVCWLREMIQDGSIRLAHIPGDENVADIFTKVLGDKKFKQFRKKLLHGDRRVFRETAGLVCLMQMLSHMPDPALSIPLASCTCHKPNFVVWNVREKPSLLHARADLD